MEINFEKTHSGFFKFVAAKVTHKIAGLIIENNNKRYRRRKKLISDIGKTKKYFASRPLGRRLILGLPFGIEPMMYPTIFNRKIKLSKDSPLYRTAEQNEELKKIFDQPVSPHSFVRPNMDFPSKEQIEYTKNAMNEEILKKVGEELKKMGYEND